MAGDKVAELIGLLNQEDAARWISNLWSTYYQQRAEKMSQWAEIDKYIFATDTSTTSNSSLPWTHSTHVPKLTQIRDNLHANYLSGLFPNDKWLTWVAYTEDAAKKETAENITSYMTNKARMGNFRDTMSLLIYDYIDRGNAFAQPTFEARYKVDEYGRVPSFIGPKCVRIDPYDIVFNPLASDFAHTPKIVRTIQTLGSLRKLAMTDPSQKFWDDVVRRRELLHIATRTFSLDDWYKAEQYVVDGFGSLQEYYGGDSVEILEFYGDYHDPNTGELHTNRMITVVDRSIIVRDVETPGMAGEDMIEMVGWRKRPNNLWAMGPLDNLVGMQYMIDHYINMGANALDLKVMPPKKIIGDVEEFIWGPNEEIHIDEQGDVQEMAQQFGDVMTVREWIKELEDRMELYAGAPREAMGIRTPGEKTAFEVQSLQNAAGRIFGEKIVQFELFMERVLNNMLQVAYQNLDITDVIQVVDNDIGAVDFRKITKEDITANGVLRPIGARHFAQKAQELQNLVGIFNSPIGQMVMPHTSSIAMSQFIEDVVDLRGYNMFSPYVALQEKQEEQAILSQAQEDHMMNQQQSEEELMAGAPPQDANQNQNQPTQGPSRGVGG